MNKRKLIFISILTVVTILVPIILKVVTNNLELVIVIPAIVTVLIFIIYNRYAVMVLKNNKAIELSDDQKQISELKEKNIVLKEMKKFFLISFGWFLVVTLFMGLVVYNTL